MQQRVAIVTAVFDYAGPPAAAALAEDGMTTVCHSEQFTDPAARASYDATHPNCYAAAAQSPEGLVTEALARFGRIDAIVSNDAADVRRGPIHERTADDYRMLFEDFSVRPLRLILAALAPMKAQGAGQIVLITSGAPLRPAADLVLYAATRAATNSLVKSLAIELGPFGIAINAVAPYLLASNFFPRGMDDPVIARRVREAIPQQRMGRPEEIGPLITLLASGRSGFISGQVVAFSGGGA